MGTSLVNWGPWVQTPQEASFVDLKKLSQLAGFEPTRAEPIGFQVQRLNHSATTAHCNWLLKKLEMQGIEPRAFHMQSERSTTELHPQLHLKVSKIGNKTSTRGGTRTPNLPFRRPTPHPLGHAGKLVYYLLQYWGR